MYIGAPKISARATKVDQTGQTRLTRIPVRNLFLYDFMWFPCAFACYYDGCIWFYLILYSLYMIVCGFHMSLYYLYLVLYALYCDFIGASCVFTCLYMIILFLYG